jgi:thiamine biosynthesis lipoprotein
MQATLNGLVQGYASDRAWAVLREHGIDHALIDAGEYRAIGNAAPGLPWRIGVRRPDPQRAASAAALADVVPLHDAALASSGNDGLSFSADRRLHHILDPRTGVSPAELAGVTVLAADACSADALSTACMVLGVERGRALVERVPGAMALFQHRDGQVLRTRGWPRSVG